MNQVMVSYVAVFSLGLIIGAIVGFPLILLLVQVLDNRHGWVTLHIAVKIALGVLAGLTIIGAACYAFYGWLLTQIVRF